jgi:hypothetical protein
MNPEHAERAEGFVSESDAGGLLLLLCSYVMMRSAMLLLCGRKLGLGMYRRILMPSAMLLLCGRKLGLGMYCRILR